MKKVIITFISLLVIYIVSLALIYSLPNFKLSEHVDLSSKTLDREHTYPVISQSFKPQTMLDNFTDLEVMVPRSINDKSVLVSAMDMKGYPRYWHGYQVILKPLLSIFTYEQVRFIYNIMVMVLFVVCCSLLWSKISRTSAIALAISMCFAHIEIFGMSIQFSNVFIVLFASIIYLLSRKDIGFFLDKNTVIYFFVIGSIVNFVDLLTAPIVTLGIPLAIIIIMRKREVIENTAIIFKASIAWGGGYGLTWISKWCISSVILSKNVISNAIHQIFFRTMGDNKYPINRPEMLASNFDAMFIFNIMAYIIPVVFLISIILQKRIKLGTTIGLSILSLIPYAWYIILTNHSQMHFWFTYRAQVITMFCFLVTGSLIIQSLIKKKDT